MKRCPYWGHSNYDNAIQCRKCDVPFVRRPITILSQKFYWGGPGKARTIRDKVLAVVGLGTAIKPY